MKKKKGIFSKPTRRAPQPRAEVFALRLDPQLRYAAELAANRSGSSVAGFISLAVENMLKQTVLVPAEGKRPARTAADVAVEVWEPDPAERLVRLVRRYPRLLTLAQQRLWRVIQEETYLWHGKDSAKPENVDLGLLRDRWEEIIHIAEHGEAAS